MLNPSTLQNQYHQIINHIRTLETRYRRPTNSVELIAVSKKQPIQAIETLNDCGQLAFGESYAQEALIKISALKARNLSWHFIGPIQSNKIKSIAEHFSWVHSVDSLAIAKKLDSHRPKTLPKLNVCLQINIDSESEKRGLPPDVKSIIQLIDNIQQLSHLTLRGLMVLPKQRPSDKFTLQEQRMPFKQLSDIYTALKNTGLNLDTLSMGMSDDMEAAIAEGATHVRIGSRLFKKSSLQ